ncbi:MAG: DUF1573 domain-containing protein [Elusimicrobiota bacterium]
MMTVIYAALICLMPALIFAADCGDAGCGEDPPAVLLLPEPDVSAGEAGPRIVFPSPEHDFGEIPQGETVTHDFVFKNEGPGTLEIGEVRSSCGCTAALVSKKEIGPGEEGRIKVTFRSRGFRGNVTKTVSVPSNDLASGTATLKIKATVKVEIDAMPSSVSFGDVRRGASASKTVTLEQAAGRKFNIKGIEHKGEGLAVTSEPEGPASSHKLHVALNAPDKPGTFADVVLVRTDDEKQPEVRIPVSARIVGDVIASPASLFLGRVDQGTERTGSVAVRIGEGSSAEVLSAEIATAGLSAELKTVQPGKEYRVTVTLSGEAPAGALRGTLKIKTSNEDQPWIFVPVNAVVPAAPAFPGGK